MPVVAGIGPAKLEKGLARGFAQTPAGSVLAAIHIQLRATGPDFGPNVYRPTIADQVVGPDKGKLLAAVEAEYQTASAGGVTASGAPVGNLSRIKAARSQVIGYRVDSFDQNQAIVQLLSQLYPSGGGDRALVNAATVMRWVEGDWRLTAPLNGDSRNGANRLAAVPDGYTVFAG